MLCFDHPANAHQAGISQRMMLIATTSQLSGRDKELIMLKVGQADLMALKICLTIAARQAKE